MTRPRVFVDTNIIIEAFRTKCWKVICGRFSIETVEKCVDEALAGDPNAQGYVHVDQTELKSGLAACHAVSRFELAKLVLDHPECQALDDGEMHLLALLYAQDLLPEVLVMLSTADKAAIVATGLLGGLDSLRSLESLAQKSGVSPGRLADFANHYRTRWLDEIRTKIRLGVIP